MTDVDTSFSDWKAPPPNTNPRRLYRSTSKSNINVNFNTNTNSNTNTSNSSIPNNVIISNSRHDRNRMEVGLENLGNTCFMNSTLQCLVHIPALVAYFLNNNNLINDSNKDSPVNGIIADSFAKLVNEIHQQGEGSSVTPNQFKKAISSHAPHLLDYQQQDCQEFLRFLLDGLAEDLCRSKAKKKNQQNNDKLHSDNSTTTNISSSSSSTPQKGTINNDSINSNTNSNTPDEQRMARLNSAQKLRMVTITERNSSSSSNNDKNDNNNNNNNNDNNNIGDSTNNIIQNDDSPESEEDTINTGNTTTTVTTTATSTTSTTTKTASEMANTAWQQYLDFNDSIVTDIFAGQLQSTIECLTCANKSYCYDPFLDLSIPIKVDQHTNGSKGILKNFRFGSSGVSGKCSLEECIDMFVQEEVLDEGTTNTTTTTTNTNLITTTNTTATNRKYV